MRFATTILLTALFSSLSFTGGAQNIERYNSFSYNVNEGLLQSNVIDIAFDQNNFCWLSFANGIQKFDGKNFTIIPEQPGLPDTKATNFFTCSSGQLLVSHSGGISRYDISSNRFALVYKMQMSREKPVIFIGEDEGLIYFYAETGDIVGINCQNFKVVSEAKTGLGAYSPTNIYLPKISSNIINHRIAMNVNSTVYLWDLQKKKFLYKLNRDNIFFYSLVLKSATEVLYYDNSKQHTRLYVLDMANNSTRLIAERKTETVEIFRGVFYSWRGKHLLTHFNHLYETDSNFRDIQRELVNFKNDPVADNAIISKVKEDNFGNLYVVTVNDGFRKLIRNNYPIKYYGTGKKEDNFIISLLPDKHNNRILAGTYGKGLLIFDTLQRLVKHIRNLPGEVQSFSPTSIIKGNRKDYLIFVWGDKTVWSLSKDLSRLTPMTVSSQLPVEKRGIGYYASFLFQNEQEAIVRSEWKFYKVNFVENTIVEYEKPDITSMGGLYFDNYIITHSNDQLIFLDTAGFKEIKRIPFKNTGDVRCFTKDAVNGIYLGSNKGIFKIDKNGKILLHLSKESGLPDECIYAMNVDNDGFLWCSTNKGIFRVNKDNSVFQLTKNDGLQENEFNTNAASKTADGEIFFAGVNGISSFFPSAINNLEEKINLFFTKIKVNNEDLFTDTATWSIDQIELPHQQNSLSFDFIAMANNNPGQYIYQYKMENVDKQWMQNNDMQTVHYHLQPGKYVFKIYASRFFDKDAMPLKEISILIRPPFWKTWWFRAGLIILLVTVLAYLINQFNRRKYLKKLSVLESEQKVRLERERISRDLHDNIGAYANAVLYSTELLEKEKEDTLRNELMKDLKFASKDIITSLRETIWALKKDNYTAEDCLLRIRNFVQPLTRYYQHINFDIEGEAPASKILHYTKALNLVRIVQEAVTNAIKHTDAKNIDINSNFENGFWELVVTDNGKGFDPDAVTESGQGNGLNNMRQRATDAGFDLHIRSWKDAGTSVIIRINGGDDPGIST